MPHFPQWATDLQVWFCPNHPQHARRYPARFQNRQTLTNGPPPIPRRTSPEWSLQSGQSWRWFHPMLGDHSYGMSCEPLGSTHQRPPNNPRQCYGCVHHPRSEPTKGPNALWYPSHVPRDKSGNPRQSPHPHVHPHRPQPQPLQQTDHSPCERRCRYCQRPPNVSLSQHRSDANSCAPHPPA